ncbi:MULTISPECIES: CoA transferase [unclassified Streptomyces]|uniref:CoA transferase n=1 Tax=unclassified Streptomyces TaxID=2593676 RepID=UPI0036E2F5A2
MTHARVSGTEQAWAALGGDPALLAHIGTEVSDGLPPARLPVAELARSAVAVCSLAAAELAARRTARPVPRVRIDDGAVAAAFTSERHLRIDGRTPTSFAPLSRFWRTADGWVRTHANYPHHRARLLATLGLAADTPDNNAVEAVAASFAGRRGAEIERTVYAAGGLAVVARTPEEWAADPRGAALAGTPLMARERVDAAPARRTAALTGEPCEPLLPAAGLRVLDLTRVLAGPVATRTLALLGADVLRIDAPRLPESQDAHSDTGFGKRSADLDLGSRSGRAAFDELLAGADAVVIGYRPGALDPFGLTSRSLAARRPGLVIGRLSAWGHGPWAGRRGFDSLVQVATGIAAVEAAAGSGNPPGALPAQALDHGTGYLLAAAVLRALTDQHDEGGTRLVTLSLARTASWLLDELPRQEPGAEGGDRAPHDPAPYAPEKWLTETDSPLGRLRHARSPVAFDGSPTDWSRPPGPLGADAPVWLTA